jgi:hypothetical protein
MTEFCIVIQLPLIVLAGEELLPYPKSPPPNLLSNDFILDIRTSQFLGNYKIRKYFVVPSIQ